MSLVILSAKIGRGFRKKNPCLQEEGGEHILLSSFN
jgi:hypothetical protein